VTQVSLCCPGAKFNVDLALAWHRAKALLDVVVMAKESPPPTKRTRTKGARRNMNENRIVKMYQIRQANTVVSMPVKMPIPCCIVLCALRDAIAVSLAVVVQGS